MNNNNKSVMPINVKKKNSIIKDKWIELIMNLAFYWN